MVKINSFTQINEDMVESICIYDTHPLKKIVSETPDEKVHKLNGRHKTLSVIFAENGELIITKNLTGTIYKKLRQKYYITDNRCYIKKDKALLIYDAKRLVTDLRNKIRTAKEDKKYVNLTEGKTVRYYIYMVSGRLYGVANISGLEEKDD